MIMTRKSKIRTRLAAWLSAILLLTSLAYPADVNAYSQDAYDQLREKWKTVLTGGIGYDPLDPDIAGVLATLEDNTETYWNTLDTASSRTYLWSDWDDGSISAAETSYNRLRTMAIAYSTPASAFYQHTGLRDDILSGIAFISDHWYHPAVPQTNQWYKFEIGVPKAIVDLNVLMYDDLIALNKQALIATQMDTIAYYSPDPERHRMTTTNPGYMSGANLVEKCLIWALRGILLKDGSLISEAQAKVTATLDYVEEGNGFYKDGSFVFHDTVPYTGSYGLVLIGAFPELISLLDDSAWEIVDPRIEHLYQWIYEAFEPVMFRGMMMDMVRGRAISRIHIQDLDAGRSFMVGLSSISQFAPPPHDEAFKGMVKKWGNSDLFANIYTNLSIHSILLLKSIVEDASIVEREAPVYNKTFPMMDRVVHHRPDFTFAISMSSNRIGAYEYAAPNQEENRRGYYTGEGMTYLYNNDMDQFHDAFWPTVDPKRLPGITVDYDMPRADGSGNRYRSPEDWVGAVEIGGVYGAAGMRLNAWNNTLTANKSWFMFDNEVVALGAGITSSDNRMIETVVENRRLREHELHALTVDGVTMPDSSQWSAMMTDIEWAHLTGSESGADIGYVFPEGASVQGLRETRSGAWSDINPYVTRPGSDLVQDRHYLSLVMQHGLNATDEQYAYIILPGAGPGDVSQYNSNPDIEIIENSSSVQAVKENELQIVAANFWQDRLQTADMITTNKKSAIMTRIVDDELELSVADPTQTNTGVIEIALDQRASGILAADPRVTVTQLSPSIRVSIDMNGAKGQSVKASFRLQSEHDDLLLPPIADAAVRNGNYADENYGNEQYLQVKGNSQLSQQDLRKAYLKFDLRSVSDIESAGLQLFGSSDLPGGVVRVYASGNSWQESELTWNGSPVRSSVELDGAPVGTESQRVSLDITDAAVDALEGDGFLTLVLEGLDEEALLQFNSREHSVLQPLLYIEGTEAVFAPEERVTVAADAYVRGGSFSGTNYGTSGTLRLHQSSNVNTLRKSYLAFDLTDYASVSDVKMSLFAQSDAAATVKVFGVADDNWSETGITWDNAPEADGAPIAEFSVAAGSHLYSVDITDWAQSRVAGGGKVSLLLDVDTPLVIVDFQSKESAGPPPELTVSGVKSPLPPLSLIPSGDAYVRGGSFGDDNYGHANRIRLYEASSASTQRKGYVKFQLPALQDAGHAVLRLYGATDGGDTSMNIHMLTDNTWDETSITWNNRPVNSTLIGTLQMTETARYVELEITDEVQSRLAAGEISFLLEAVDSGIFIDLHSKENDYRPQLVLRNYKLP
ncbi:polysaccharide lyase family 8 super-sandwich domain-containing protein [Paenibacillus sp. 1P07SE]|uniref:CBM96 family carbohydrate-binding protein n=1 Tax=Paenibacillus sp. 1P07SE TaxID=3132209 RepID=UPI0039A4B6A6